MFYYAVVDDKTNQKPYVPVLLNLMFNKLNSYLDTDWNHLILKLIWMKGFQC